MKCIFCFFDNEEKRMKRGERYKKAIQTQTSKWTDNAMAKQNVQKIKKKKKQLYTNNNIEN